MYHSKEIVQEIRKAARRRIWLLVLTPILFLLLSITALQLIEPKFKSSTSILVQKEETLNPLVLYEMAVNIASEDRLKSFNEIIYSRSTMQMLIDSLEIGEMVATEAERQGLITSLRKNVGTSSRASDSFEISFMHPDPVKARDGVELLANHFIQTRLRLETRRNDETVEFFTNKLDELEQIVEEQRNRAVDVTASRLRETPMETAAIQTRLQEIDTQLGSLEWQGYQEEQKLEIVSNFLEQEDREASIFVLFRLPFDETPLGSELSTLLREYDELRQQYTAEFPRTRSKFAQINQTVERIPPVLTANIARLELQRSELSQQRNRLINDIERSFVAAQRANTQQSDYSIYEALYNEMKVKLEQARMTRDIGSRAAEQFIVLDPPFIAETPASPNKMMIVAAGLFIGLVIGVLTAGLAEMTDTTIRDEEDLQFDKPVIAYLTYGK